MKPKPLPEFSPREIRHFWADVDDVLSAGECWPWGGTLGYNGYGLFNLKTRTYLAHRVAYFLITGFDPQYQDVLHSCDNKICINPEHLRLGSDLDNTKDRIDRGRQMVQYGEDASNARLTSAQVRLIRTLCADGKYSQKAIGGMFGVSQTTVCDIHIRRRWKSLP